MPVFTPQPPRTSDEELHELADELRALIEEARRRARRRRTFVAAVFVAVAASGASAFLRGGDGATLGRSAADASPASGAGSGAHRWNRPAGPDGAMLTAFAIAPDAIYAGTIGSGLFKSTDRGRSWQDVNSGETAMQRVDAVAVDPVRPRTVYAGTGDGVFKTTDGGATWRRMNRGLFQDPYPDSRTHRLIEGYIGSLAVDPRRPATVYAGPYRSLDGGGTWRRRAVAQQIVFAPSDPAVALGTTSTVDGTRLVRSADGGRSWIRLGVTARYGLQFAIDPHDSDVLYVARWGSALRASTDGGASWQQVAGPFGDRVGAFVLDPAAAGTIYVWSHIGLFKTVDAGATWRPLTLELGPGEWPAGLWVDARIPRIVYASTFSRLLRSDDGGETWNDALRGLHASSIADLEAHGGALYAAHASGLARSTDGGRTWRALAAGQALHAVAVDPDGAVYVGTQSSGVLASRDGGKTWRPANNGLTARTVLGVAADASGRLLAATWGGGLLTSNDHARSWHRTPIVARTFTVTVAGRTAYAGTGGGGVWRSVDGGRWEPALNVCCGRINALAADPANPRVVFAANGFGLFRSNDGGDSWQRTGPGGQVEAVAVDPFDSRIVVAGTWRPTGGSVFRSGDGGLTWSRYDDGLRTRGVGAFAFAGDGRRLFAGTLGNGVVSRGLG